MEPQKRTRKKKELPLWSQSLNEGAISKLLTISRIESYTNNLDRTLEDGTVMTPYSDYVPIDYLFFCSKDIGDIRQGDIERSIHMRNNPLGNSWETATVEEKKRAGKLFKSGSNPLLSLFIRYIDKDRPLKAISDYLNFDSPISMAGAAYWGGGKNESVLRSFCGGSNYHHTVNMRSFMGYTGHHMFLLRNMETVRPEVVLAVPRKLYMDVKMRFCLTGEIDLSKCILFIDRDLDKPTFTPVQFRVNTYRKYLKPYLDTLKVDVFKVPSDFIKNSCFLQNYKLRESSPVKRKEEKEMIIKEFYRIIKEKYPQVNDSPSSIEFGGGLIHNTTIEPMGLSGMMYTEDGIQIASSSYVGTTGSTGYTGATGAYVLGVDPYTGVVNTTGSNPVSLGGAQATDILSAEETRAIIDEYNQLLREDREELEF